MDQGNLAVAVDGRIFAAVWDQDATQRAEGIDIGAYRVFVIDQAKVIDLTRGDDDGEATEQGAGHQGPAPAAR